MRWSAVMVLCAGALIAGIMCPSEATQLLRGRIVDTPAPHYVPELREGDTVPNFALVDQRGHTFPLARFRGQALVLSFVYTRCRDETMCSLASAKFARLQRMLAPHPIHLLQVTLDPAYDTPATLERYGAAFGANPARWTLATGETTAIADLAARAGIVTTQAPRGLIHSEAVLIFDRNGRLAWLVHGNRWTAEDLLAEARASLGTAPTPVARLWLWLRSGVAAVCGGSSGISTATALSIFVVVLIFASFILRRFLHARSL